MLSQDEKEYLEAGLLEDLKYVDSDEDYNYITDVLYHLMVDEVA